jgi:hypothetical protein
MRRQYGIWIDHRKAVIVLLEDGEATTTSVPSGVAARARTGGSRTALAWGSQDAFPEDREQRRFEQALKGFYRTVAKALERPTAIYVVGPGEAKGELVKELAEHGDLASRVLAIEPAGKLTQPQLVKKVKAYFAEPASP